MAADLPGWELNQPRQSYDVLRWSHGFLGRVRHRNGVAKVIDCDIQHHAISFVLAGMPCGYLYNADHPRTKPAVARRAAASISGREGPQWGNLSHPSGRARMTQMRREPTFGRSRLRELKIT